MKRIKMTVAYDGTGYCGWQLQPNGVTIEEILNGTLSELLKEPVCVIGASRTDSGVHALGNVAVFDTESRIPGEKLCYAVNQKLPEDIKPFIDPVFANNVILTQTERLTMSSRPKNPAYARNKNVLIIGGSGSGKTRFFVKPNLMQCVSDKYPCSFVVTDPKGYNIPR